MSAELNFFDTYILMAIVEEIVPKQTFFKDRYFPTGDDDIFASDKVLTEYRKGDRKMAAFVSARAGDIPMERRGFEIHEYQPAFIAPSRLLTQDDLRKRGFGEAIYANSTPAQRAARLQRDDLSDMDIRITRREEWMAVQTMINNSCTMQSYIDDSPLEIASKYEIAAANLAIALQTDTVSVEQRSELRAAIGSSIDKLVDALNMIIVCYNKRMYAGEIAPEKAAKCVKAEYAAIGLSNVVAYDYFSAAVGAFFTRKTLIALSTDEKLAWVKTIFEQNERCGCQRVKDALFIYCLRLLSHMGIVTADLSFTNLVMREINAITEDRKNAAIMPQALVTEL